MVFVCDLLRIIHVHDWLDPPTMRQKIHWRLNSNMKLSEERYDLFNTPPSHRKQEGWVRSVYFHCYGAALGYNSLITISNSWKVMIMQQLIQAVALALLGLGTSIYAFQVGPSSSCSCRASSLALTAIRKDESLQDDSRRAFVTTGTATALSFLLLPQTPSVAHAEGGVDYKAVASDVMDLVKKNPDWGPSKLISWCSQKDSPLLLSNESCYLQYLYFTCDCFASFFLPPP